MLVPAVAPIRPAVGAVPFSTELVLERSNKVCDHQPPVPGAGALFHSLLTSHLPSLDDVYFPSMRTSMHSSIPSSLHPSLKDWNRALESPYYLYPVHVSLSFLYSTTLASSLYLVLLRFLNRDYKEVRRA